MSNRYDDWENDENRYGREDRSYRSDRDRSRDERGSADTENRFRDDDAIRRSRTAGMLSRDYGGYGTGHAGARAGRRGGYDDYSSSDFDRRDRDLTYGRYGRDLEQNRDRYDAGRYAPRRNTTERSLDEYRWGGDPNDYSSHSNYSETPSRRSRSDYDRGYDRRYDAGSDRSYNRDSDRSNDRGNQRGFLDRASDEVASWFGDEDAERRRRQDARKQGSYAGRGPRGYKRSDERIREDINDRLTDHAHLDATEIEVSVSDGNVTLSGSVDSRNAKRLAEDLAESVTGVRDVDNNIRVNRANDVASSTSPSTDTSNASSSTTTSAKPSGTVSTSTPSASSSATSK